MISRLGASALPWVRLPWNWATSISVPPVQLNSFVPVVSASITPPVRSSRPLLKFTVSVPLLR